MKTTAAAVQEGMARPTADTSQVTFRIPNDWLHEADLIAGVISRPGFEASRTDALRAAIGRGFEVIAKEAGPFHVSAWDGSRHRCLYRVGLKTAKDALDCANELAKEHAGGKWTVFRVYATDKDEPVHIVHVKAKRKAGE